MQVNILVEGQTEEMFVKEQLQPYFADHDLTFTPIIISTKRQRNGTKFKGGVSSYGSFKADLQRIINSTPHGLVTTMIDYYGLPTSFPGYAQRVNLPTQKEKVEFLEQELWNDMGSFPNFIPHIQLHEFETLLFSSKDGFNGNVANPALVLLCNIVEEYSNPEDINEGETTAPSKRILVAYPSYEKIWEGNLMAIDVGIELMKSKCPHFSDWLEKIRIYGK